jgi:hypothetical protein
MGHLDKAAHLRDEIDDIRSSINAQPLPLAGEREGADCEAVRILI